MNEFLEYQPDDVKPEDLIHERSPEDIALETKRRSAMDRLEESRLAKLSVQDLFDEVFDE